MYIIPDQFTNDSHAKPLPISSILKKLDNKTLDVNAEYQRGEVWSSQKKTCLAQSILGGITIPPIILNEINDKLIAIDGKQRISAMRDFKNGEVKFYNESTSDETCYFSELSENIRDKFLDYTVTAFIYKNLSSEQEREIFQRINYGVNLSTGEQIKGLNSEYIKIIKQNKNNIEKYLKKFGIPSKRESYMECSTAILALYNKDYNFVSKGVSCLDYINNHIKNIDSETFYKSINDTFIIIDEIYEEVKKYCLLYRNKYNKSSYSKIKWTDLLIQIEFILRSIDHIKIQKKKLIQVVKYLIHMENKSEFLISYDSFNNIIPIEEYNDYKIIFDKRSNTNVKNFFKDRINAFNNLYKFINKDPNRNKRNDIYHKNIGSDHESICKFCNIHKIYISNFHTGHIISKKNGGTSEIKNLYPLCGTCNTSMGSLDMDIYIQKNKINININK